MNDMSLGSASTIATGPYFRPPSSSPFERFSPQLMGGNFYPITPVMDRRPAYPSHFQQPSPVAPVGPFQGHVQPVELPPTMHQIRETEEYDEDFKDALECLSQNEKQETLESHEDDEDEFLIFSEFFP
jgi:hypothetical protein